MQAQQDTPHLHKDPFKEITLLRDAITGILNDFSQGKALTNRLPEISIQETDQEIVIQAALYEIEREGIHLDLRENTLILTRPESSTGTLFRALRLFNPNQAKAEYKNGVLEIHLSKSSKNHF